MTWLDAMTWRRRRQATAAHWAAALLGAGAGAGAGSLAMFLLDPGSGRARRAKLRDRTLATARQGGRALERGLRDARYRALGRVAEARNARAEAGVADDVLVERVRARVGHVVSHPGSIEVTATEGRVTLSGPVMQGESARLVRVARGVRGVWSVEDRLESHREPGNVPGLQGDRRSRSSGLAWLVADWPPSARLGVGTLGAAATAFGLARRGAIGAVAALAGIAALARLIALPSRRRQRTVRTLLARSPSMHGPNGVAGRKTGNDASPPAGA